jgi:hypothetical protein
VTEERIKARITEYQKQRDQFVADANRQVAALEGAIQALEALLEPEPEAEKEAE